MAATISQAKRALRSRKSLTFPKRMCIGRLTRGLLKRLLFVEPGREDGLFGVAGVRLCVYRDCGDGNDHHEWYAGADGLDVTAWNVCSLYKFIGVLEQK